jgi:hypothetical protein
MLDEKVATEYNKKEMVDYDENQFSNFTITGASNLPSAFDPIDWQDAMKATKECLNHLEKARNNMEKSGTHDDDIEDANEHNGTRIGRFTGMHYVVYWNHFVEENQDLLNVLTARLDDHLNKDCTVPVNISARKKKRKQNDAMVESLDKSNTIQEKRLTIADERTLLLKKQVAVLEHSARVESFCRLSSTQEAYKKELIMACGSKKDAKQRTKAHMLRLAARSQQEGENDNGNSSSDESNASLMDKIKFLDGRLSQLASEQMQDDPHGE